MKSILLKTFVCGLFIVLSSSFVSAQENLPLVTVTGQGEVTVTPDEAVIHFGVDEREEELDDAKQKVDATIKRVSKLAVQKKIDPAQIKLDYLNIHIDYDYNGSWRTKRYYRVSQGITIVLKDITMYEDFISEFLKAGINTINNVEFRTSQMRKYKDQARALAVIAAREKATALATTLGQTIGGAYSIDEGSEGNIFYPNMRASNIAMESGQEASTVLSGQIPVKANVTVKFYLK